MAIFASRLSGRNPSQTSNSLLSWISLFFVWFSLCTLCFYSLTGYTINSFIICAWLTSQGSSTYAQPSLLLDNKWKNMKENLSQRDGLDKKENSSAHEYLSNFFFCDDQFFSLDYQRKKAKILRVSSLVGFPWRVLQILLTANRISRKAILALVPIQLGCRLGNRFCGWLGWKITSLSLVSWDPFIHSYHLLPLIGHTLKKKTVFCPFFVLSLINYKFANVKKKSEKNQK